MATRPLSPIPCLSQRVRAKVRARIRARVRTRVRLRWFVVMEGHNRVLCIRQRCGGRGVPSGLRLEGRESSMLTVILGGNLEAPTRV